MLKNLLDTYARSKLIFDSNENFQKFILLRREQKKIFENEELIINIIDTTEDINYINQDKENLLFFINNNYNLIKYAMEKKINIHQINNKNENILFKCSNKLIIELLIENNINIHHINNENENCLFKIYDFDIIKLYIDNNINFKQKNKFNCDIMFYTKNYDVAKLLIQNEINKDCGIYMLLFDYDENTKKIIELMIKNDYDINIDFFFNNHFLRSLNHFLKIFSYKNDFYEIINILITNGIYIDKKVDLLDLDDNIIKLFDKTSLFYNKSKKYINSKIL